jgi:hypothetical protein
MAKVNQVGHINLRGGYCGPERIGSLHGLVNGSIDLHIIT